MIMNSSVRILHFIPGRTRISLFAAEKNIWEAKLRMIPGVYSAVYSPHTQTAVLYHEAKALVVDWHKYISVQEVQPTVPLSTKQAMLQHPKVKDLQLVALSAVVQKIFFTTTPIGYMTLFRPIALTTLFASREIIFNGLRNVLKPNEDTLTTAAVVASLLKGSPSSALIIFGMSTVSELLNEYTIQQTRGFVRDMMEVDTKFAWHITESGAEKKVPVEKIRPGDCVMVFQGDKVPFDGEVIDHSAEVDQSAITGEYLPVHLTKRSYVFAGSVVTEGKIAFRVDKVGEDLTVNRMIKLIENAQDKQATIQTTSDKFTKQVVPLSFILAGAIYVATRDWNRVLNMLVIDYVCGVQLSTATAISATIGKSAQQGVLVKGGQTLEKLAKVDTIIFDKTGTITEGRPVVTKINTYNGYSEEQVLAYAASVEEHSTHPLASAILNKAREQNILPLPHQDETLENYVGRGILVQIDGANILAGSLKFMNDYEIEMPDLVPDGIYVAKGRQLIGAIEIEDQVRPGINPLIHQLKRDGLKECIMLTGDNEKSARQVMAQLDIDRFVANAMPAEKTEVVKSLKLDGQRMIMMVGDGINDAPALAYADIGLTMGAKKTDIAMETADVVVNSDNPMMIYESIQLSKKAMRVIKQNITATLLINTGAILLGTFGIIPPVVGAAVHNAATIGVVLNSAKLLMKDDKIDRKPVLIH